MPPSATLGVGRSAEALGASYRDLFELAPDAYVFTDREGIVLQANRAATRLLACPLESLTGLPLTRLLRPLDADALAQRLRSLSDGEEDADRLWEMGLEGERVVEAHVARAQGGLAWLLRERNDTRRPGFLGPDDERLRTLVENVSDSLAILDGAGYVLYSNPAASRAVRGEPIGQVLDSVHPDDRAECRDTFRRAFEQRVTQHVTYRNVDGSGSVSWHEAVVRPYEIAGGELHVAVVTRDVTDRKQAEKQRQRRNEALFHAQRVSAVGGLAEAIAHELRQPLAAIANFAGGCVRRLASAQAVPAEIRSVLEEIRDQAGRANDLLSSITGLARGATRHEWVDIDELIAEALHLVEPDANEAGVVLDFQRGSKPRKVPVDRVQIVQLLVNLFLNAVEAMGETDPHERRLEVRTRICGEELEVTVRDRGRGIPKPLAERLMDPFVSSKPGGMGLGLSIARAIVDSHVGRLWFTPNTPRGTVLHVALPYWPGELCEPR